jgi:hypothetical protein
MLHSIQQRYREKLRAIDGEIGHVRDFYFDDKNWIVAIWSPTPADGSRVAWC